MTKILLALSFCVPLMAYQDLGVVGKTYEITEKDAMEEMEKAAKKVNINELKLSVLKSVKDSLSANLNLPFCAKSNKKTRDISIMSKQDIDIAEGDIHISKGSKVNTPYPNTSISYFVINLQSQEELAYSKKEKMSPFLLVAQGDIRDSNTLDFKEKYVLNQTLADQLDIKCTPSIVSIQGDILSIEEIYIKRGKKK